MAKQKFNRLINHNVLFGAMIVITCLQIYNYIRLNKPSCIIIFFVAFVLSHQGVTKNMTISLFIGIFVANFLLGCASFVEGHTVMIHTPFPHKHGDPTDKKMIPGFDGPESTEGGVARPGEEPQRDPSARSAEDDENLQQPSTDTQL